MTDPSGSPETTPPAYPSSPQGYPSAPPAAAPVPGAPAPGAPVPGRTLGIVALILAFFVQLVALILGIVALVQSRKVGAKNLPAVWAIIVSAVLMVLGVVLIVVFFSFFWSLFDSAYQYCLDNPTGTYQIDGQSISCTGR